MKRLILILFIGIFLISFVSAESIPLYKGWNQFGIIGTNTSSTDGTMSQNISLSRGYNLIGYSSYNNYLHNNTLLINETGSYLTISTAVTERRMNNQFHHWNNSAQYYEFIPYVDSSLRTNQAYWVYLNQSTSTNITLTNVGGALMNYSTPFNNLNFSNGTTILNITDALTNQWIGRIGVDTIDSLLRYWSPQLGYVPVDSTESINSWRGYVVWANLENISLLVGEQESPVIPNHIQLNNISILGTNSGRAGRLTIYTDNRSIKEYDLRDAQITTQASNYTFLSSRICPSGTLCNLQLDIVNVTDLPRKFNLTYFSTPAMVSGSLLNLTWTFSQANMNVTLRDYGTDTTFTTPVASGVDMNTNVEYSTTLGSTQANHYFRLEVTPL